MEKRKIILCPNPYRDKDMHVAAQSKAILDEAGFETIVCLPFQKEGYGADMSTQYKNGYFEWSENSVRDTYKSLFGVDMPEYHPTDNSSVLYENGNYKISVSNRGDGRYEFISAENVNDGMNVMFKETDSTGTDFGTVTFHLVPADNSNGYIITQKTN
mgnify:CR=1 FL=1